MIKRYMLPISIQIWVLFMIKMCYRRKRSKDGLVTFVLKISTQKKLFEMVDQLRKRTTVKLLRKLSNTGT